MLALDLQHNHVVNYIQNNCMEVSIQDISQDARENGYALQIVPFYNDCYFLISESGDCYAYVDPHDYPEGWLCPGEQGPKTAEQIWYNDHGVESIRDMDNLGGYPSHYGTVADSCGDGCGDNNGWMN